MAVTQNPHIGRSKNSFSTAVFSKWKNKNTMRAKPITVANPNTIPQQRQRNKFALLNSPILRSLESHKVGFNSYTDRMTEMNAFVSLNKDNVQVTTDPDVELITEDLIFAQGSLTPTASLGCGLGNGSAQFSWDHTTEDLSGNQEMTDLLMCQAVVTRAGELIASEFAVGQADRADGTYTLTFADELTVGDRVDAYANFYSSDKKRVSNTQYMGTFTRS